MDSLDNNIVRKILKRFLCQNCQNVFSKLVNTDESFANCTKDTCNWIGEEISEEFFKKLKNRQNNKEISNSNNNHNNYDNYHNRSTNNNNNNNSNINYFNISNLNGNNNISYNFSFSNTNPFRSILNDSMFGNFFQSPFRQRVYTGNVSSNIYMPEFSSFGSSFNETFRDNFSSNFRSNIINNEFFQDIIRQMQERNRESSECPISEEALNKLKVFKLETSHCKKKENSEEYEMPNCIVCISDIEIGSETMLLPCGHMFHEKCIILWLKKHNTCPVCRFEMPKKN